MLNTQEIKHTLNKLSFIHFTNYKDAMKYVTPTFNVNFNLYKYADIFSDTSIQKIFISNYIFNRLSKQGLLECLSDLQDKISFDIYAILNLLAYKHYYKEAYDIVFPPDIIKQLDNLVILNYLTTIDLIEQVFDIEIYYKLLELNFNEQEINIIDTCFEFNSCIYEWFRTEKPFLYQMIDLRSDILELLYDHNRINIESNFRLFKSVKQYFTNELLNINEFVEYCCKYKLLDKDFIDKVFNKKTTFRTLYDEHRQFNDYINSLNVMLKLSEV